MAFAPFFKVEMIFSLNPRENADEGELVLEGGAGGGESEGIPHEAYRSSRWASHFAHLRSWEMTEMDMYHQRAA